MTAAIQRIFERYIWAGMNRDADALAQQFTEDGVYDAPLQPEGRMFPHRLAGRAEIRARMAEYYRQAPAMGGVDVARSRYTLHVTADPDVFIAEIDTVFTGSSEPMALVQIFHL